MTDFALGAMLFGTRTDERTSFALLDRFVERGGTWIDTANCYSFWADPSGFGGQSEELLGRWLASRPGVRDRVKISTKVGCEPTVAGRFPETAEGLSAAAVKNGIEGSLRRLGVDRVDLYWAHKEDRDTSLEESAAAFGELVAAGMVDRLGCSNFALWRVERARSIARANGWAGYTALQLQHSYLQPRPLTAGTVVHRFGKVTDETLDYVQSNPDTALWAYTPLLSGGYTRPDKPLPADYDHPGTDRRLAALAEVAAETGATANEVVLAWLTGGAPAVTPIIGVSTVAQLDEAFDGIALPLTADQRSRLDAA
ncbi:MAG TPA: aldo/keto reductase, partial [Pilimelia sp.]|nr:aldo/keto reductase [Pilimelia sp.]